MNPLYPRFPVARLPSMLRIALLGAIIAGLYGAVHDQISFAISLEYFTKMKFQQFDYADFGFSQRVFAAEVGFLATWWVGMFAGWFLARAGLAEIPWPARRRMIVRSFTIAFATTIVCGIAGALLGLFNTRADVSDWDEWRTTLELEDVRGFIVVAYLHAAGYGGALLGLIAAIVDVVRTKRARFVA